MNHDVHGIPGASPKYAGYTNLKPICPSRLLGLCSEYKLYTQVIHVCRIANPQCQFVSIQICFGIVAKYEQVPIPDSTAPKFPDLQSSVCSFGKKTWSRFRSYFRWITSSLRSVRVSINSDFNEETAALNA